MRSSKIHPFFIFLISFVLSNFMQAQEASSRIYRSSSSDTVLLHIQLQDAEYDPTKNKFPFYVISHATSYNQSAEPLLVIKKTRLVENTHASILLNYYSKYLTTNFELESIASLSRNENLNQYKVFPFRLNASNQVEELISYDVNWQISNTAAAASRGASSFKSSSVLASGNWYKIAVNQTGIYKITKSFLANMGINTADLNPDKLKVFGNGGKMVPEKNKDFRYDDLEETSLKVVLAADSSFDYALFYATGTTDWVKVNGGKA